MESIDNLIETLEIINKAVRAGDKSKGVEAVTIFLAQFMFTFGDDQVLVKKTFPILKELRNHIQAGEFEEANPIVLALLMRLKQVKDATAVTN